jgi:hypothetical protein
MAGNISTGSHVKFNDTGKATFGASDDLQIYHDGSNSRIREVGTGGLSIGSSTVLSLMDEDFAKTYISCNANSDVRIYHNNAIKLATTSIGIDVTGTLNTTGTISSGGNIKTGTDTGRIFCGASNDLQIYHDGSNSWIQDAGTGILGLKTDGVGISMLTSTGDTMFQANRDGAVNLYYDNAQKLATTTTGINVTGSVTATSLSLDNGVATIDSGTGTVSNAEMTLDTWAATEFQSAKYTITARGNGNKFQTSEILVFHDNANTAYITEYGIMSSDGTPFVTYLVDVTSGNVRLRATLDAAWSGGDNVKFTRFAQDII